MENIVNYVYLAIVVINFIIVTYLLLKKRKETKTTEEKKEVDELIKQHMLIALQNIKSTCKDLNLNLTQKQLKQIAKKTIKETKDNA